MAHVKVTALITPQGTVAITGLPLDRKAVTSECKISDDVNKLLQLSTKVKAAKPKAEGGAGAGAGAGEKSAAAKKKVRCLCLFMYACFVFCAYCPLCCVVLIAGLCFT